MFSNKFNSILFILPFIGFVSGYFILYIFLQNKEIVVPNIIGKNLQDCIKEVSHQGLSLKLLREQVDPDLPQGVILQQIPASNQKIKPNQNILITISKKPKPITATNFLGFSHKEINLRTKKSGIQNKSYWIKSIFPLDSCIAQSPQEGQVLQNQKLTTYISSGQNGLFVVPNFKSFSLDEVKQNLNDENISLEVLHSKDYGQKCDAKDCFVIDQKPMAGSIIDLNKPLRIQLQVSP